VEDSNGFLGGSRRVHRAIAVPATEYSYWGAFGAWVTPGNYAGSTPSTRQSPALRPAPTSVTARYTHVAQPLGEDSTNALRIVHDTA
jgi:hypothetical protein